MERAERERRAKNLGMTLSEYDDLQIWLRHNRIGVGRTYQQEVERSRQIEAARSPQESATENKNG
jgi:hypothetical protein